MVRLQHLPHLCQDARGFVLILSPVRGTQACHFAQLSLHPKRLARRQLGASVAHANIIVDKIACRNLPFPRMAGSTSVRPVLKRSTSAVSATARRQHTGRKKHPELKRQRGCCS